MLRKLCGGLLFALLVAISPAHAQNPVPLSGGCGTGNITNSQGYFTEATNGQLCVAASVSASITGFTPGGAFATLTSAGTSGSVALPAGTTVAFQNTGTTTVSCTLGVGSATASASQIQVPAGSTVFVTPGSNTWGACIDQTGSASNTVVLAGGSGLGTGFGGAGGSGSSAISTWAGGTLGAMANYGTSPGAVLVPGMNAYVTNTVPTSIASAQIASGAFASGSFVNASAGDPCMFQKKTNLAINQNGTSSVQLVALSGSTTIYVCSLSLIAAGATTVALTTGTGTACVTGNAAVIGSTTAGIANSISLAANGGLTLGNGEGTVASGAASSELCMILGTNVFVSGNLTYIQQ